MTLRIASPKQLLSVEPFHQFAGRAFKGLGFEEWDHLMLLTREWERGESQVILKARQVGVSWLAAIYAVYLAKKGGTTLALSQGKEEAMELLEKCSQVCDVTPGVLRLVGKRSSTRIRIGKGRIIALPATEKAGRSYTANLVIADEAAFHPYASKNYAAYRPTLSAGGQYLCISTGNGNGGFFHDMYFASKEGSTGYKAVFLPWTVVPERDQAWLGRERATFKGIPQLFPQEYPATETDAFIGLEGLVYPDFSRDLIREPVVPWERTAMRYWGSDYGGGDPSAIGVGAWYDDEESWERKFHVYDLLYFPRGSGAPSLDQISPFLLAYNSRAPFTAGADDPKEAVTMQSLRDLGLPANRADNSRSGIGLVATYLKTGLITFSPHLEPLFTEFSNYRWKPGTDPNSKEKYLTSTPADHHGDCLDMLRYMLARAHLDAMAGDVLYANANVRL